MALTRLSKEKEYPMLRVEVTELEPERSVPALVARDFDLIMDESTGDTHRCGAARSNATTSLTTS